MQRTTSQNRAIHLYIELISRELQNNGHSLNVLLKDTYEIPATSGALKEIIVKPLCKAMFGIDSTTKLTTKQVDELYEVINKQLAEKCEVHIPFPTGLESSPNNDQNY